MSCPITLLLSLLALTLALPVQASTLLPFTARFEIYQNLTYYPFVDVQGGGVANVSSTAGGMLTALTIPAGAFNVAAQYDRDPLTTEVPRSYLNFSNGVGHFSGLTAHGGGGSMPMPGIWRFCILSRCDGVLTPPGATFLGVASAQEWPIALGPIGNGGSAQAAGTFHTFTVVGEPWTKGYAENTTNQSYFGGSGFGHGPLSNTGTTAQAGGVLGLATPFAIHLDFETHGETHVNGFAWLTIEFTPEPASGSLLALGLGMLAAGRRRLRGR